MIYLEQPIERPGSAPLIDEGRQAPEFYLPKDRHCLRNIGLAVEWSDIVLQWITFSTKANQMIVMPVSRNLDKANLVFVQ